jgi:ubiquitin-conjugating enzyme E2 J2
MAESNICQKRLEKEYLKIKECPIPNIIVKPALDDIKTWYFLIHSLEDCDYADGVYMGIVKVPNNYPSRAPTFEMVTPSGRFQTYTKLCTTFSHYHPEQWSPNWKISTTLIGLVSFMLENGTGVGSITGTNAERKNFAKDSVKFNYTNSDFKRVFLQDYPDEKNLVINLKKYNGTVIELEKKSGAAVTTITPTSAPELIQIVEAVSPPKPIIIMSTVVKKMELNAIIWLFIDTCLEEKDGATIDFNELCQKLAKWANDNSYRPTDYSNKITKKAVHEELKKIKPDEYIKGKSLKNYRLI